MYGSSPSSGCLLTASAFSSCSRENAGNQERSTRREVAARRRPQRPRGEREGCEEERCCPLARPIADRHVKGASSCVVEDRAGVCPFLETGKARRKQRHRARYLPDAKDNQEVNRVVQVLHDRSNVW